MLNNNACRMYVYQCRAMAHKRQATSIEAMRNLSMPTQARRFLYPSKSTLHYRPGPYWTFVLVMA